MWGSVPAYLRGCARKDEEKVLRFIDSRERHEKERAPGGSREDLPQPRIAAQASERSRGARANREPGRGTSQLYEQLWREDES